MKSAKRKVNNKNLRELAYAVLQQAAEDLSYHFETLSLWCALLDLSPMDFQQRVIRLSKKDGACSSAYEVIELLNEEKESK